MPGTRTRFECSASLPPLPPQPPAAQQRGALQLLDSLEASLSGSGGLTGLAGGYVPGSSTSGSGGGGSGSGGADGQLPGGAVAMPLAFLDDFGARFEEEGLQGVADAIGEGRGDALTIQIKWGARC